MMAAKPSRTSILEFYSHDELLDLAKESAKQERENQLAAVQQKLSAISEMVGGTTIIPSHVGRPLGRPPGRSAKKSPGRPKGSGTKSTAKKSSRKRAKNEKSLAEYILDVLNKKPKGVPEIMEAIQENGYQTTSSNPKRLLYMELNKQAKKGIIQSKGRGKYIRK